MLWSAYYQLYLVVVVIIIVVVVIIIIIVIVVVVIIIIIIIIIPCLPLRLDYFLLFCNRVEVTLSREYIAA